MFTYATKIKAIDPATGEVCEWSGPRVKAISEKLAREWLDANGFGYCKIVGTIVSEISYKTDDRVDYENWN